MTTDELLQRLEALAWRREDEGIYTDAGLVLAAIDTIRRLSAEFSAPLTVNVPDDDGQPDEMTEWRDHDPDC